MPDLVSLATTRSRTAKAVAPVLRSLLPLQASVNGVRLAVVSVVSPSVSRPGQERTGATVLLRPAASVGLVDVGVHGVSAGNDDIEFFLGHVGQEEAASGGAALAVSGDEITGVHPQHLLVGRKHEVDTEVEPNHASDCFHVPPYAGAFDALRVDDAVALPGVGGVVEHDAIVGRHRGQNRLGPATETSATVRNNATDRNLQIRLPHQAIYSEVGTPVGSLIVPCLARESIVIDDLDAIDDPPSQLSPLLRFCQRPVRAQPDDDADVFLPQPTGCQFVQDVRQHGESRGRSGQIVDDDDGVAAPRRQLRQRLRADRVPQTPQDLLRRQRHGPPQALGLEDLYVPFRWDREIPQLKQMVELRPAVPAVHWQCQERSVSRLPDLCCLLFHDPPLSSGLRLDRIG